MTAVHTTDVVVPAELIAACAALAAELRDIDDRLRPALARLEALSAEVDAIQRDDHDRHLHLPTAQRDARGAVIFDVVGLAECYRLCDAAGIIPPCDR